MSDWLEQRLRAAPERLRERMRGALEQRATATVTAEQLAQAALLCLERVLQNPADRASALDLLAADALLTHACELASERNELPAFVARFSHDRFAALLSQDKP